MKFWIGLIIFFLGLGCILCGAIWQQVLCYQKFGVIFKEIFIPHWSAFFYLGVIPMIAGWIIVNENT